MNDRAPTSIASADPTGDGPATRLSRRQVLLLLGGAAGGSALLARGWSGVAGARPDGAAASPTIPAPSLPEPELGPPPPGVPTVADLAASLDWDVARMFRFVADEVAYHPYGGALRGATGTLWGRAGNSADQALLLAALLAEAKAPYRFVVGALDDEHASRMIDGTRVDLAGARKRAARVLLPPDVADGWVGDGPWERAADVESLLELARTQLADGVTLIDDALAAADVAVASPADELPELERSAHVWLQYADGPNWIDLDPSVIGAEPSVAYATAPEVVDVLADDQFHTVTVRIVAEVVTGGVLTRTDLLSHDIRCADVSGIPVVVVHAPGSWLGVASAITGMQDYVPTLLIGEEIIEGLPIALRSSAGVVDALSDETDQIEGQTVAEWLEVDVTVPGGPVRTATRQVFDRLTPAERESETPDLTALPPITFTHIDDEIGDVFLPFAGPLVMSVMGQTLPWSYFADELETLADDRVIIESAMAYHLVRELCRLELLADLGYGFFAVEPTVIASAYAATAVPEAGREEISVGVDIISARSGALAIDGMTPTVAPGILAGLVDHIAERLLVESPFALPDAPEFRGISAGRIFELAAEQGIPIVTVREAGAAAFADAGASVQALIDQALAAGQVVVVPEHPVTVNGVPRLGWWEIDPLTGLAIDRLDDGRGASAGEYFVMLKNLWKATTCLRFMAKMITMVVKGVAGVHSSNLKIAWDVATGSAGGISCMMS